VGRVAQAERREAVPDGHGHPGERHPK